MHFSCPIHLHYIAIRLFCDRAAAFYKIDENDFFSCVNMFQNTCNHNLRPKTHKKKYVDLKQRDKGGSFHKAFPVCMPVLGKQRLIRCVKMRFFSFLCHSLLAFSFAD